jgi:NADH-quinone oxidoreductase subunit F
MRKCPTDGIIGGKNRIHVIDQEKCTSCGTCLDVCPANFDAVVTYSGEPVPPPILEEKRTIDRKKKK